MKQYFYSYFSYLNGVKMSFGHGAVSVDYDSKEGYAEALKAIEKDVNDKAKVIHLVAFNLISD